MSWTYDNSLPLLWLYQNALPAVKYIRLYLSYSTPHHMEPTNGLPSYPGTISEVSYQTWQFWSIATTEYIQILIKSHYRGANTLPRYWIQHHLTYTSQFTVPYLPLSVPQYVINIIMHFGISITGSFINTTLFCFRYGGWPRDVVSPTGKHYRKGSQVPH